MTQTNPFAEYRRHYLLTQPNAGATDVVLDVTARNGSVMEIDGLFIKAGTYAAGRTATVDLRNASEKIAPIQAGTALTTGQFLAVAPVVLSAAQTANGPLPVTGQWRILGNDRVRITLAALAQNETVDIWVRARCTGAITFTVTGGTTTTEEDA